jgi:molecular chaperone GrpE
MPDTHKGQNKAHPDEQVDAVQPAVEPENAAQPQAVEDTGIQAEAGLISADELAALRSELEKTKTQSAGYFDGWQRERADFNNYRKRIERDQAQAQQNAVVTVVKKYLVILDDLNRALKTRPSEGEAAAWANGIELIAHKLQASLEAEGIRRMPAENESFDPTRHEAITHEESPDHQSGQIIEVVQDGYLLGERVIRPALVRVAC